jgi:mono/diheme cytochrome c family protein
VTWGLDKVDEKLLRQILEAKDFHVRAAAVRVLRYSGHHVNDQAGLLLKAAGDEHGRVRLEAIVAASWLDKDKGLPIVMEAGKHPLDDWMVETHGTALARFLGTDSDKKPEEEIKSHLKGVELALFIEGKKIFSREGYCITCHQENGKGLEASGFPPLAGADWVTGNEERLIKLTLKGLMGPIEVNGKKYPGQVPMTPFGGLLNDEEVAAVLTYVRNSFGNKASVISAKKVREVRAAIEDKKGFYSPEELLNE